MTLFLVYLKINLSLNTIDEAFECKDIESITMAVVRVYTSPKLHLNTIETSIVSTYRNNRIWMYVNRVFKLVVGLDGLDIPTPSSLLYVRLQ